MSYQRADFAPLRDTGYGIGFHWTTWTMPAKGPAKSFAETVELFDVGAFVEQAVEAGAGHVLITATHELQYFAGPNAELDKIMKGRTCKRDLLMEIADGLNRAGIKLMLYYHHGCDAPNQDPAWQAAVGGQDLDQTKLHDTFCKIVGWMSEHYGPKVIAYWFDAGYGPMRRAAPPFEKWTAAAKLGFPGRLVTYNPGIEKHTLYTTHQDYWAGECIRLNFVPHGPLTPAGLPWYNFTSWHAYIGGALGGEWGMNEFTRTQEWPAPAVQSVVDYYRRFQKVGGAVTFNLLCYQDGSALPSDLALMKEFKKIVR